jgi:hypothetical protein
MRLIWLMIMSQRLPAYNPDFEPRTGTPRLPPETPPWDSREKETPTKTALLRLRLASPAIAGLCSTCYRARRHSRDYFAGNREAVLARLSLPLRNLRGGEPRSRASPTSRHQRPGSPDHRLLRPPPPPRFHPQVDPGTARGALGRTESRRSGPAAACLRNGSVSEGREAGAIAPARERRARLLSWTEVRSLVLDTLSSPHSKRAYSGRSMISPNGRERRGSEETIFRERWCSAIAASSRRRVSALR